MRVSLGDSVLLLFSLYELNFYILFQGKITFCFCTLHYAGDRRTAAVDREVF